MLHNTCMRCNKPLSDPDSKARGYGGDCWAYMGGFEQMTIGFEEQIVIDPTISDGYAGARGPHGGIKVVKVSGGKQSPLNHIMYHSPTGFEWGYAGSGPADLAKSILVDCIGKYGHSPKFYQEFKAGHVAGFGESWEISADAVRAWWAVHGFAE